MATKDFAVRTEPHGANLGPLGELHFVPEVFGDEFLDGYTQVQAAQAALSGEQDLTKMDPEALRDVYGSMRGFLGRLMTPESAARFLRFEVVKSGKVVDHYRSRDEAEAKAADLGPTARFRRVGQSVDLPDKARRWGHDLRGSRQSGCLKPWSRTPQPRRTPSLASGG
ncbi:hypothetical protein [Streptomyces sp. NPDC012616]|uniref:hypothetical protein n=1 Tax=Streptomyces sp. NPDC012616 TaxID=3364840 RepID=UPI0036E82E16